VSQYVFTHHYFAQRKAIHFKLADLFLADNKVYALFLCHKTFWKQKVLIPIARQELFVVNITCSDINDNKSLKRANNIVKADHCDAENIFIGMAVLKATA